MDLMRPRRLLPTPKPPRLERLVKPPTASEERAPNTSTRLLVSNFQSHFQAESFATATVRTSNHAPLAKPKNTDPTAFADYLIINYLKY
jgi:hypothetical protein